MKSLRLFASLAAFTALLFAAPQPLLHAQTKWTVVMSGLDNPRGLTFVPVGDGWALYVAESGKGGSGACAMVRGALQCAGTTGAVSRYQGGVQERIVTGLPSYAPASGEGATGPHDVSFAEGNGFLTLGLGGPLSPVEMRDLFGDDFGWVVLFSDDGQWFFDTDVASYEQRTNPGGNPIESNPYGLLAGAGRGVVVDAGGNSLLAVSPEFEISTIAIFPSRAQGRATDSVSNSVARGPDGAYYVGELTGAPFVPNTANVWRVVPGQEPAVYCSGFNFILDLDFDRHGNLYVLEHASAPFPTGSGTLYRVRTDCSRTPIATGLTNPTSVAIGPDGNAYISNFGTSPGVGEVIRVDLQAPSGLYQLVASHSGKCLDVPEWSLNNGTPLIQWTCNGGDNQTWSLETAPDGYSRLVARHSGKCLDVSGESTEDRADIIQWQCHGGANQQWQVEVVPGGYQLVARHSGKCVDVRGQSTDDGGSIIQWSCHGGANQTWILKPVGTAAPSAAQAVLPSRDETPRALSLDR
jgi:hypothetical protein